VPVRDHDPDELERLRGELAQLRDSEQRYRSVIAAMSEGVVVQTATGEIVACNAAAERILGLTADQMAGRTSLDPRWRSIHEDGSPFPGETHPAMVTLRTGRPCRNVVMGVHRPEGGLSWIEINSELVPGAGDGVPHVVCTFNDVTAYRKALDDLRVTDERLVFALRAARMGAWQFEVDSQQVIWSDTVEDVFGVPRGSFDGSFETYLALIHPDDRAHVRATIEAALADPAHDEFYVRHRIVTDHGERWIDGHARVFRDGEGRPVRMAGVAVDVTEARRLEVEVRKAQRLEAIGRLAGGVAHDFNNVLTAISCAVDLAARPGRDPREELALIRDVADRAARLPRQLLAFARRQAIGVTTLDLGALVAELRPLLGHLLGERVELAVEVAPGAWTVRADQGQLEQVLVNLIVNARDAIADTGRVRIAVEARGAGVAMTVEDDGAGMPAEVLEHVFEPFFTTKEAGTGLGLASCYGIVEQHGGRIEIRSTVGAGTRVDVVLPRSDEPVAAVPGGAVAPAGRGRETVLLVEDDPVIRGLAESTLADEGYRVLVARDGIEALELANRHLDEIALVVTDVVMPRLGGIALVRRLRGLRPGLPALLVSGYAPDADVTAGDLPLLDKPYTPAALLQGMRELLDQRPRH
jgi:PAS domain S-box-containing protein